jgi:hypothetical protein
MNRRGLRSARTSFGLLLYTLRFSAAGVSPGSWAAAVVDARDGVRSPLDKPGVS